MSSSPSRKQRRALARGGPGIEALAGLAGTKLGELQKQMQGFVQAAGEVKGAAEALAGIQTVMEKVTEIGEAASRIEAEQARQRTVNLRLLFKLSQGALLWSSDQEENWRRLEQLEEQLRAEYDAQTAPEPGEQSDETP